MGRIPRWLALLLTGGLLAGCSATTTPDSGPTRSPQASPGPGVSDTEIHVGFIVATTDANEQIGASGITTGDEGYQAKLVVEDINENGGIAGRTVVPVFHGFDATSDEPIDLQEQGACTDFTQDRPVFAVFPANAGDELKQ